MKNLKKLERFETEHQVNFVKNYVFTELFKLTHFEYDIHSNIIQFLFFFFYNFDVTGIMAYPVFYIDVNFDKYSFINCLCFDQRSLVLIKTFFRNLKIQNF